MVSTTKIASGTIAPAVRAALIDIQRQRTGSSSAEGDAWLADLRGENVCRRHLGRLGA